MQELRRIERDILAWGKVDADHLVSLRLKLYSGGTVGRAAADFLVELHKRIGNLNLGNLNPAFEMLYYRALRDYVLVDGRIAAEETAWLRPVVFVDGAIKDKERRLLHELKDDVLNSCTEFDALFDEAMEMPYEVHTTA